MLRWIGAAVNRVLGRNRRLINCDAAFCGSSLFTHQPERLQSLCSVQGKSSRKKKNKNTSWQQWNVSCLWSLGKWAIKVSVQGVGRNYPPPITRHGSFVIRDHKTIKLIPNVRFDKGAAGRKRVFIKWQQGWYCCATCAHCATVPHVLTASGTSALIHQLNSVQNMGHGLNAVKIISHGRSNSGAN